MLIPPINTPEPNQGTTAAPVTAPQSQQQTTAPTGNRRSPPREFLKTTSAASTPFSLPGTPALPNPDEAHDAEGRVTPYRGRTLNYALGSYYRLRALQNAAKGGSSRASSFTEAATAHQQASANIEARFTAPLGANNG